ncbi:MAG: leucine-rich repeat domain-containing protein [Clostridia bacterium]|nr:leucine-rich repeat domain-containing protein [Clostridia bacterium]
MKKLLALTLAALLIFAMIGCKNQNEDATEEENEEELAATNVYENFTYAANAKGELEITGYQNTSVERIAVTIPDEIDGRPIVGIGDSAFSAKTNISSITIPDSVGYIGDFAFADCDYLTKITLPKGLTTIGKGAFRGCDALTKVSFPAGLLSVGEGAFENCKKLTNFTLPEGLLTIEDGAFRNCVAITKVTVPTSVIDLGDGAFIGCKSLYEVNLLGDKKLEGADNEILSKINALIANSDQSFATPAQVAAFLEEEGYYLSGISQTGVKFIWDTNTDKVYGAMTAADEKLVASINEALVGDTSKDASNALELMISNMKGKGFDPNQLNASVTSDKYVWNAAKNEFTLIYAGEYVFSDCSANTIISITEGSFFAEYAKNADYITVAPATAPEGAKIFSNNTLAFYYPEAWTMTVVEGDVMFESETSLFGIVTHPRNLDDDHTLWGDEKLGEFFTGIFEEDGTTVTDKAIVQSTTADGLKFTKISCTISDSEGTGSVTLYVITIGNSTYEISFIEQPMNAAHHALIENSFVSLR